MNRRESLCSCCGFFPFSCLWFVFVVVWQQFFGCNASHLQDKSPFPPFPKLPLLSPFWSRHSSKNISNVRYFPLVVHILIIRPRSCLYHDFIFETLISLWFIQAQWIMFHCFVSSPDTNAWIFIIVVTHRAPMHTFSLTLKISFAFVQLRNSHMCVCAASYYEISYRYQSRNDQFILNFTSNRDNEISSWWNVYLIALHINNAFCHRLGHSSVPIRCNFFLLYCCLPERSATEVQ